MVVEEHGSAAGAGGRGGYPRPPLFQVGMTIVEYVVGSYICLTHLNGLPILGSELT